MYLYIEVWKAKEAWLRLTTAQRKSKLEQLLLLAKQHPITGVIPFSFRPDGDRFVFDGVTERPVIIDNAVARPTGFHYAAAWMVPTRELIKQFEDRVEGLGWWWEYFDQQNAWGVMDSNVTVAAMVSGNQRPSTDSFEGSRPGEERNGFCWCPPGTFQMGFAGTPVTISQGFWLGRYPVTQEKYLSVMGENPSSFSGTSLPVESVGRSQILAFCEKMTRNEQAAGRLPKEWEYSLPTEAQWEYAARAGTSTAYAWGDDIVSAGDNSWNVLNSGFMTHPIGQKKPNQWGLYDTIGNVLEWCQDAWVEETPGGTDPETSETDIPVRPGQSSAPFYVCRGGGWFLPPSFTPRVRVRLGPGDQSYLLGFRVAIVRTASATASAAVQEATTSPVFQNWTNIIVGQWAIQFTSPGQNPGNGSISVQLLPDKSTLQANFTMATQSGSWNAVWDSSLGTIRQNTVGSDGSTVLALITQQGENQWSWGQTCNFANGQIETNVDLVTVADGGKTLNHLVTNRMMDGRPLPDITMVLTRSGIATSPSISAPVQQPTTIKDFQDWANIIVGRWAIRFTSPGDNPGDGSVSVQLLPDKNTLQGNFKMGTQSGSWKALWDSSLGVIRQNTTSSDGSTVLALITRQGENQWSWGQTCNFSNGQIETNIDQVTVADGRNTLNHLVTNRMMNGRSLPDITMVLTRTGIATGSRVQ